METEREKKRKEDHVEERSSHDRVSRMRGWTVVKRRQSGREREKQILSETREGSEREGMEKEGGRSQGRGQAIGGSECGREEP